MNISETKIGAKKKINALAVCSKLPKDYLRRILGENVHLGTRYGCKCNLLRDGGILRRESYRRESYRTP